MRTSFIVLCFLFAPTLLSAQDTPKAALSRMAGCTLQGHIYTCSKADLERALSLASSITCISQPANHASDAALADLIRKLGKTPASANTPSDLTFILEPLLEAGVQVGPGTTDLAKLASFSPQHPALQESSFGFTHITEIQAWAGPPSHAPPRSLCTIKSDPR